MGKRKRAGTLRDPALFYVRTQAQKNGLLVRQRPIIVPARAKPRRAGATTMKDSVGIESP